MTALFNEISSLLDRVEAGANGWESIKHFLAGAREGGSKLVFIGNGGSAAIASHMATDWMIAGNFATLCFNDSSSITALANDTGYENSFKVPLAYHARLGDILFAISSSGESKNILEAAELANRARMNVVTLSGFDQGNSLRKLGGINFYVPSRNYRAVENVHLAILHSLLEETVKGGVN